MKTLSAKTKDRIRELANQVMSCNIAGKAGNEDITFDQAITSLFVAAPKDDGKIPDLCVPTIIRDAVGKQALDCIAKQYRRYSERKNIAIEYSGRPGDWASWAHVVCPLGYVDPLSITTYTRELIRKVNLTNLRAVTDICNTTVNIAPGGPTTPLLLTVLRQSKTALQSDACWRVDINKVTSGSRQLHDYGHMIAQHIIESMYSPTMSTKYASYYAFPLVHYMIGYLWRGRQISLLSEPTSILRTIWDSIGTGIPLSSICIAIKPNKILYEHALYFESFTRVNNRKSNIMTGDVHKGITYKDFFSYETFFSLHKTRTVPQPRREEDIDRSTMDMHESVPQMVYTMSYGSPAVAMTANEVVRR